MSKIHTFKDGRLHVYIRHDTYKGKLKSENWVGRAFVDKKQRVVSSGTKNLDEAKIILEKWYDDLTNGVLDNQNEHGSEQPIDTASVENVPVEKIHEEPVLENVPVEKIHEEPVLETVSSHKEKSSSSSAGDGKPKTSFLDKIK